MTDSNNPAHQEEQDNVVASPNEHHGRVTVNISKLSEGGKSNKTTTNKAKAATKSHTDSLHEQRLRIYETQLARQKAPRDAPFPIENMRDKLIELEQFEVAKNLDRRGIEEMEVLHTAFEHLYLVDDFVQDILANIPKQDPYGWEATSRVRNHLCLPTVGTLPRNVSELEDGRSIMGYALTHFGVASYTNDRAYYIGHVVGYLLMSYFFAHLKIQYGVTPMRQSIVPNYQFATPTVADNTRLVATLEYDTKRKIYQLAVFCARLSLYSIDKAIEKMLITEVNDFDKKKERELLDNLLRFGG